jgi:hypothetical protein
MVGMRAPADLFTRARADLSVKFERVGFFLADFDEESTTLTLRDWWLVPPAGYERQGEYHVTLTDDAHNQAIRWAWQSDACLVEAHSHGDLDPAEFSLSDLAGFDDWVPHLWWRLRGRPYAAIVTATTTLDVIAWTARADTPELVGGIDLGGGERVPATGRTIERFTHRRGPRKR